MLIVSFFFALLSLRKELKKPQKEIHAVHKELQHEKVLYVRDLATRKKTG